VVEVQRDSTRAVNDVQWLHVFVTVQGRRMEGWLLASVVDLQLLAQDAGVTRLSVKVKVAIHPQQSQREKANSRHRRNLGGKTFLNSHWRICMANSFRY